MNTRIPTLAQINTALAQRSLAHFVRQGWPVLEPSVPLAWNWHIDAICQHLEAVSRGQIKNLIINVPPGHMKSMLVGVFWPAWAWLQNGGWRALFSSYAADLARRDSVKTRALIESDWYSKTFSPAWQLTADQNTKDYFQNTKFGARMALSVGGKVTGFRGDCVVVDDPHNATEANSKPIREAAIEWWDQAMSSRLNDPRTGAKVVIMQRLHELDLTGHLLEKGGYEHLCLPAEFEPDRAAKTKIGWRDPRTQAGELLFPELFTREVLDGFKTVLGSTGYAGQFQQRPTAGEGGMFKREWFRFWRPDGTGMRGATRPKGCTAIKARPLPSKFDEMLISADCSFKETDSSDFVAIAVIARLGAEFFVLDLWHKRAGFSDTVAALRLMAQKWPAAKRILIEDKANGSAVIDTLKGEIPGVIGVNPEGGKESRASAVQPSFEAGQVYLPEGAGWVDRVVDEFAAFPRGRNDDVVDTLSQGLIRMLPSRASFAARWREKVRKANGPIGL